MRVYIRNMTIRISDCTCIRCIKTYSRQFAGFLLFAWGNVSISPFSKQFAFLQNPAHPAIIGCITVKCKTVQ